MAGGGSEPSVGPGGRILSACAGSAAVAMTVTPLDVAKVKMQALRPLKPCGAESVNSCPNGACRYVNRECAYFFCSNGITEHRFHKKDKHWRHVFDVKRGKNGPPGVVRTLRNIYAEAGVPGLYAGLPVTMVIAVPANVLYFATYESFRDKLQSCMTGSFGKHVVSPFIAGGIGRAVAVTACAPLEVVRTRVQAGRPAGTPNADASTPNSGVGRGIWQAITNILRYEGPLALFKGLESTLWRDVPFSAGYWLGVEAIRSSLLRKGWFKDNKHQAPLVAVIASCSAGAIASWATTPFDVVKTRRQIEVVSKESNVAPALGLRKTLLKVSKEEGVRALFVGATPRVGRVAPACGIMLGTYELTKQLLRRGEPNAE